MSTIDSNVKRFYNELNVSEMETNNNFEDFSEEKIEKLYDISIDDSGNEWFVCKFNGCNDKKTNESEIFEHLRQHFAHDIVVKTEVSDNCYDIADDIECKPDINTYVGNRVECIEISDDEAVKTETTNWDQTNGAFCQSEQTDDNLQQYFDVRNSGERHVYFCQFSDECLYETNLRVKINKHIRKHLTTEDTKPDLNNGSIEFNHCYDNNSPQSFIIGQSSNYNSLDIPLAESTPFRNNSSKRKQKSGPKSRSQEMSSFIIPDVRPHNNTFNGNHRDEDPSKPKPMSQTSDLIDVNFNHNNTILSLKGMASVKKLEEYIQCQVIDGCKYFCCNYSNNCEFKSRRSQETANHVHCAHLGFYLKCVRPNCEKIFRTPGSWREHQKNHICNFGLYGYQKGVTGVCRNAHLLRYQEKIIVENNHKAYCCKFKGCSFVTRQRTACKRHIHNSHICPYRKNKQWKTELLYYMGKNSMLTDKPIIQTTTKKVFFCRRTQCNAKLVNEADLKKHENQFCKYRHIAKAYKNERNATQKLLQFKPKTVINSMAVSSLPSTSTLNSFDNPNIESNRKNSNTNEQFRQNKEQVHQKREQTEERRSSTATERNGQNLKQTDIRSKCEKFIERKNFEGIDYILCCAPNCKFTTKLEDKIYEHITKMHSILPEKDGQTQRGRNLPVRKDKKRNSYSSDSNQSAVKKMKSSDSNSQQLKSNGSKNPSQNIRQKTPQISNQSSIQSTSRKSLQNSSEISSKNGEQNNKFKDYFEIKRIESEPFFFCIYPESKCRFYAPNQKELYDHISQTHIVFSCDIQSCRKEFKSESSLEIHKRNHICGFGIKGMNPSGVCALDNVRKYRREVLLNGCYHYECKVCLFVSDSKTKLLSHAHNRHIHPQPPPQ